MNLPELPKPVEHSDDVWNILYYTKTQMQAYGQQCAQHALALAASELRSGQGHNSSAEGQVRNLMSGQDVNCKRHPDAPHGFDRNGSHNNGRYTCTCESWTPGDAS